ncbi:MAG TPA: hypothetical protein VGF75_04835, partial [Candidatus Saccharimonadales bacterium]
MTTTKMTMETTMKKKNLKEKLNQLPRIETDLPIYQDNLDYSQLAEQIRKEVKELPEKFPITSIRYPLYKDIRAP